jgi:hypothetical protein
LESSSGSGSKQAHTPTAHFRSETSDPYLASDSCPPLMMASSQVVASLSSSQVVASSSRTLGPSDSCLPRRLQSSSVVASSSRILGASLSERNTHERMEPGLVQQRRWEAPEADRLMDEPWNSMAGTADVSAASPSAAAMPRAGSRAEPQRDDEDSPAPLAVAEGGQRGEPMREEIQATPTQVEHPVDAMAEDEDMEVLVIEESTRVRQPVDASSATPGNADLILEDALEDATSPRDVFSSYDVSRLSCSPTADMEPEPSSRLSSSPTADIAEPQTASSPLSPRGSPPTASRALAAPAASPSPQSEAPASSEPPSMDLWDSLLTDIQDDVGRAPQSPRGIAEVVYASDDGDDSESSASSGASSEESQGSSSAVQSGTTLPLP